MKAKKMKWFKFYGQDYLSDPKMLALSASERSCWITLLSYASVNDNGMITFLSEQQLLFQAGLDPKNEDWDMTIGILNKLVKLKMITNDNGMITIVNWKKRQEASLTSYERVKKFREKKRNDNAMITLDKRSVIKDNTRLEENRIDESIDTPSNISRLFFDRKETYQEMLDVFSKNKDRTYIEKEFDKFILYWTEPNKSGTKVRWEQQSTFEIKRRLLTWLNRSNNFSNTKQETKIL